MKMCTCKIFLSIHYKMQIDATDGKLSWPIEMQRCEKPLWGTYLSCQNKYINNFYGFTN